MMKFLAAAGAALTLTAVAAPASAASIVVPGSPTIGQLQISALAAGDDLRNNSGAFSSWNKAFALDEGTFGNQQSFLLHYDRLGGAFSFGQVAGSFILELGANETLSNIITSGLGLYNSDPRADVLYQRDTGLGLGVTLLRGLEGSGIPLVGDYVQVGNGVAVGGGKTQYTVNYNFKNNGLAQDQVRFQITSISSAVPEPATWAMMITGFGLAGAAIRRRRTVFAAA